jgi:hypothetical protein
MAAFLVSTACTMLASKNFPAWSHSHMRQLQLAYCSRLVTFFAALKAGTGTPPAASGELLTAILQSYCSLSQLCVCMQTRGLHHLTVYLSSCDRPVDVIFVHIRHTPLSRRINK